MTGLKCETTTSRECSDSQEFVEMHTFDSVGANDDIEAEEFPILESVLEEFYFDYYSQEQSYNQLVHYGIAANPSTDVNYSTSFAEMVLESVKHADKVFLTEVATNFDDNLPSFNSIINYDACAAENPDEREENVVERARQNHHQLDESEIPLQLLQSEQETDPANQTFSGLFKAISFYSQPSRDEASRNKLLLDESQHERLDNNQLFMFDNDDRSKDFSSWFLFDSDDESEIALFKKDILGEEDATLKYFASKKKKVVGTNNQCVAPESNQTKASDTTDSRVQQKEKHHQTYIASSSQTSDEWKDMSAKDNGSSNEMKPLSITKDVSLGKELDFKDAIIKTSTPSNSKLGSFNDTKAVGEESYLLEEVPFRETRSSKYFIRNKRSIIISKEGPAS